MQLFDGDKLAILTRMKSMNRGTCAYRSFNTISQRTTAICHICGYRLKALIVISSQVRAYVDIHALLRLTLGKGKYEGVKFFEILFILQRVFEI